MVALGEEDLPEGALAQLPLEHDVLALDVTDTWGVGRGSDRSGAHGLSAGCAPHEGTSQGPSLSGAFTSSASPPPWCGQGGAGRGGCVQAWEGHRLKCTHMHTHVHTRAHRLVPTTTQHSPSQASLKYCGFSIMCPWSPEPLPSVGDRELPPSVMKCSDMASPSSGASTAGPGEETQHRVEGSQPRHTSRPLPGCRVPENPTL